MPEDRLNAPNKPLGVAPAYRGAPEAEKRLVELVDRFVYSDRKLKSPQIATQTGVNDDGAQDRDTGGVAGGAR